MVGKQIHNSPMIFKGILSHPSEFYNSSTLFNFNKKLPSIQFALSLDFGSLLTNCWRMTLPEKISFCLICLNITTATILPKSGEPMLIPSQRVGKYCLSPGSYMTLKSLIHIPPTAYMKSQGKYPMKLAKEIDGQLPWAIIIKPIYPAYCYIIYL